MIPKKIHYCWLSGDPMPSTVQRCMQTWQSVMPDYEWVLWDTHKFDVHRVPFVAQAYKEKKWAFAADYIRLYALYHEGGIYLDSDVIVLKPFDTLLSQLSKQDVRFFSCVENSGIYHRNDKEMQIGKNLNLNLYPLRTNLIQAAVLGAEKHHLFIQQCLAWYENNHFNLEDFVETEILAPDILANFAEKFGYNYQDEFQLLDEGMVIFPSITFPNNVIAEKPISDNTYAIHYCAGSWRGKTKLGNIKYQLKNNPHIRRLFGKQVFKTIDEILK